MRMILVSDSSHVLPFARTTVSGVTATVFTARGSPPALPGGRKFPAALSHCGSPSSTPQLSMTCPGK